jgi:hypothetical protein
MWGAALECPMRSCACAWVCVSGYAKDTGEVMARPGPHGSLPQCPPILTGKKCGNANIHTLGSEFP